MGYTQGVFQVQNRPKPPWLRADYKITKLQNKNAPRLTPLAVWLADAKEKYSAGGSLALTIPHRHLTGKAVAVHLRQSMAEVARRLVQWQKPRELVIEGGATAFATLHGLGRSHFSMVGQQAPGVVRMRAEDGLLVTLKPGSYAWK